MGSPLQSLKDTPGIGLNSYLELLDELNKPELKSEIDALKFLQENDRKHLMLCNQIIKQQLIRELSMSEDEKIKLGVLKHIGDYETSMLAIMEENPVDVTVSMEKNGQLCLNIETPPN